MRRLLPAFVLLCCGRTDTVPPSVTPPPLESVDADTPAPEQHPLSAKVQKKARAMTIDVTKTSVAAWTRKGDHIDLLSTFSDPQTNETVTVTMLQNVIVLESVPGALTLLVVPEEAEMIAQAEHLGSLTVVLRNEDDVDVLEERGRATAMTLLSGERSRSLQQKRFSTIQVIRGTGGPGPSMAAPSLPEPTTGLITKPTGINGVVSTRVEPVSTFAADVDTASYSLARATLKAGTLPEADAVRVEEFVNAFDYAYRPPEQHTFGVTVDAFPFPAREGWHLLHVGVQGKVIETKERKSANLVFTLDVSGSMEGDGRLELAKKAMTLLAKQLGEGDTVSIVVYGTDARLVLGPTPARERARILSAISRLSTEGATNVQAGLELAYSTAMKAYLPNGINRVVLCSDGVANNGITTADGIFARVKKYAQEGVTLSAVGFGMGSYNDALMERLADQGDGNYAYVDSLDEAKRIFVEQLTGTLQVIAKDAKFQLEFDPANVAEYRLVGFENRMLEKKDFANDKVDAGDLGAGHAMTAIYELKLAPGASASGRLATFRARYKEPGTSASGLVEKELPMSVMHERFDEGTGAARLATVVSLFAEKLRHSPFARGFTWQRLYALYGQLPADVLAKNDVVELGGLLRAAARLDKTMN